MSAVHDTRAIALEEHKSMARAPTHNRCTCVCEIDKIFALHGNAYRRTCMYLEHSNIEKVFGMC